MSQQLQTKVTLKCLENVIMRQEQEAEKDRIKAIMKKFEKNRNKQELRQLNPNQSKMFFLLMDGFNAFREAFAELVRLEKFKQVSDTQIDIVDYLISIQTDIKLTKETLTIENILAKYAVLNLKLKKQYNNAITKDFLTELTNKSRQKMKKLQSKKLDPPIIKTLPNKNKSESQDQSQEHFPPKPTQRIPQKKAPPERPQRVQSQRQQPRRQVSQSKKEQQLKKDAESRRQRELQLRRQREVQTRKQRQLQARRQKQRQAQARRERQVQSRKEIEVKRESHDYSRLSKGRLQEIQKYLESKHDIKFDKTRIKEISEFISMKFQNFMRTTLSKIINIACLKNKSNPKSGNQVTYFAPQNNRTCPQAPFYATPNSKVFMLFYKHKLQLYTQLRSKQFKKQDELRNALQAKTPEVQKKVDKKIQNYILKPRSNQAMMMEIFQEDIEDKVNQTKAPFKPKHKKLHIGIDHFLYYFQNHNYLRNSLLLFDAYHY